MIDKKWGPVLVLTDPTPNEARAPKAASLEKPAWVTPTNPNRPIFSPGAEGHETVIPIENGPDTL